MSVPSVPRPQMLRISADWELIAGPLVRLPSIDAKPVQPVSGR